MDSWGKWMETVMENVDPIRLESLVLPEDDCDLVEEKTHWTEVAATRLANCGGCLDTGGVNWPRTFQAHEEMRKQFQKTFGESAPSVTALRERACQQSKNNPFQANDPSWHELLPVRDADVLFMHTSPYLIFAFSQRSIPGALQSNLPKTYPKHSNVF